MRNLIAAIIAATLAIACSLTATAHPGHGNLPDWQQATGWPDRIVTTFYDDPSTSFAVTWRTDNTVGNTVAQIVEAQPDARFDIGAITVPADTESLDLEHMVTPHGVLDTLENVGLGTTHYHSVRFSGLKPDTLYAWRVEGARGNWSEWFQTRTAPKSGPISFVYLGDAQNGIRSHWSRIIRAAFQAAPDARFFLHAGDLVQSSDSDENWAEWFDAGSFIHAMIPVVPVPGNHENITVYGVDAKGHPTRERVRTTMWRPQFTLPATPELPETLQESAYILHYSKDLDIFVVDSARDSFSEQAKWLDKALAESQAKWKVVTMHHPYFASAEFDSSKKDAIRREAFTPVIGRHDVDLVLTGHVHTYGRSSEILGDTPYVARTTQGEPRDVKTVFVTSVSGAKQYQAWSQEFVDKAVGDAQPDEGNLSLDRVAGNTPLFQIIRIDGDTLTYEARTAINGIYDAFTLTKDATGKKQLADGAAAYGETRIFSNTKEYKEWYDLH